MGRGRVFRGCVYSILPTVEVGTHPTGILSCLDNDPGDVRINTHHKMF